MKKIVTSVIFCFHLVVLISSCKANKADTKSMETVTMATGKPRPALQTSQFGVIDKDTVFLYTLKNNNGMEARITNYGATITHLFVPDKNGAPGDVLLGFNSLEGIRQNGNPFFGCAVGRYANRIAKAQFTLDSVTYKLAANNGPNTLHGGNQGFDKKVWKTISSSDSFVVFSYLSPDGEEGYPGNLSTTIKYNLTSNNELAIDYTATTDKATPINLSNHAYFNLSAGMDSTILNHELKLETELFTPVNDQLIPTGKVAFVRDHPAMDFTTSKPVGRDIAQVKGGYDHNFIFLKMGKGVELYHPASGRLMTVYTTEPAVQFYTGNFLNGNLKDTKDGRRYGKHAGLCLETQHYPDSPNQPLFPNTILRPGSTYNQKTSYGFSIR